MDANRDHHTKRSKSERQIPYDITYMWNLKYNINELFGNRATDVGTDLWFPRGRRSGGRVD